MFLPDDMDDFFLLACVNETVDTKKQRNLSMLNTILNAC